MNQPMKFRPQTPRGQELPCLLTDFQPYGMETSFTISVPCSGCVVCHVELLIFDYFWLTKIVFHLIYSINLFLWVQAREKGAMRN